VYYSLAKYPRSPVLRVPMWVRWPKVDKVLQRCVISVTTTWPILDEGLLLRSETLRRPSCEDAVLRLMLTTVFSLFVLPILLLWTPVQVLNRIMVASDDGPGRETRVTLARRLQ
jgi:hypothetical protein